MSRRLKLVACLFVLLVGSQGLFSADKNVDGLAEQYQQYNAVVSNMEMVYEIDLVEDSIQIIQNISKDVLILNDFSKGLTKDFIFFGGFTSITEKEAYTLVPKEKGYDKVKVIQFQESHSTDGGVFYDDSKILQFAYPAIEKGAITHLNYTVEYHNPKFLRHHYFQSFIPVAKGKVQVKVHRDIELGYKQFNFDELNPTFKTYKKGKYNYYEWEVSDVKPFQYYMGKYFTTSYYSPHVAFYIKKIKGEPYFGTLDQLYSLYHGFLEQADASGSDEMQAVVNEITKGLTNDTEKARAIYYWVHRNIKYIAYEEGYSGFVPTAANEVFTKRFGDCKGMSCLIKSMMEMAGIPTYFTWVGTRHKPYEYEELPLPVVDNHMIATQFINDSLVLLDGTFEYIDFGVNPYHIQGKEVLIGLDKDNYKVYKVPFTPASYSVKTDSVKIKLDQGRIIGRANMQYTGFSKWELAHALDGVKEDKYNQAFTRMYERGNNKFKVTQSHVSNFLEYDKHADVGFDFTIDGYSKSIGDEIYVNLNLDKSYGQMIIDTTTQTFAPLENDFYCIENYVTEFEIPEGYELTYVPKDKTYQNPEFEFSLKYTQKENSVVLEKQFKFEFVLLLEDKIGAWNDMVKTLSRSYRNTIVLKKKNP